jgi:hypothetical protein
MTPCSGPVVRQGAKGSAISAASVIFQTALRPLIAFGLGGGFEGCVALISVDLLVGLFPFCGGFF